MKIPISIMALCFYSASPLLQAQTFYVTDKVLVGVYEQPNTESTLIKAMPTGTPLEILERNNAFVRVRSPDGTTGWVENSYLIDHKPAQLVVLELTDKQKQSQEQIAQAKAELQATQQQLKQLQADKSDSANAEQVAEINRLKSTRSKLNSQLQALQDKLDEYEVNAKAATKQISGLQKQVASLQEQAKAKPATPTEIGGPAGEDIEKLREQNQQLSKTLDSIREALDLPAAGAPGVIDNGTVPIKTGWLITGVLLLIALGFIAGIKWLDWRNLQRHGGFRI